MDIEPALTAYGEQFRRFELWLEAGHAGDMGYLPRGKERRRDPSQVFPDAKSVFCVAVPYSPAPLGFEDPAKGPRLARYLRGEDYHSVLPARMERILHAARERWTRIGGAPLSWKICVDTSAVLERAWCSLAGLGWVGKNSMLIHPTKGSYLLLGVAFLSQQTGRGQSPLRDICGSCTRCLEACPTGALRSPRVLDSRRCISYWTLEKKGELKLTPEQAEAAGTWIAGCDLCQEACPFNRKVAARAGAEKRDPLERTWEELFEESSDEYRDRAARTSLSRIKPEQWRRNLELARKNAKKPNE